MNLLRIEGVNIYATVLDTDDLSTRRGSSLLLLQAISSVASQFRETLDSISTGASIGLFIVKQNNPADLADKVRQYLQQDARYRHFTFVVDAVEAEGFREATESAIAANRWSQMQSFATPLSGLAEPADRACQTDRVRPASPDSGYSASVKTRHDFGVKEKQRFYSNELNAIHDGKTPEALHRLNYTRDFQTLCGHMDPAWGFSPNINGKIGVFYADGNRFGRIAKDCSSERELADWDKHLKNLRRTWLRDLLQTASGASRWITLEDKIRLETLLWGGDEFILVVPAWCALELAQNFMRFTSDWKSEDGRQPLTHACGLVLCHANAPIGPITKLAQDLAELGKDTSDDPPHNSLHWLTLESFDHAGSDLAGLLNVRFNGKISQWEELQLSPERLQVIRDYLPGLKDVLPRSTITRALRLLLQSTTDHALLERSYRSVNEALRQVNKLPPFDALWQSLSGCAWCDATKGQDPKPAANHVAAWATLLELWDYLPPGATLQ